MNILWTKKALLAAMDGEAVGDLPENYSGISIDSRTVQSGEIFFCIEGEKFDGHEFIEQAFNAGASAFVVAKNKLNILPKSPFPLIVVEDVLKALQQLAIAARARTKAKIIAITGSVGKTTTKEALRHCLSQEGRVHANPASFNNHWGVPLTLARMPEDVDYAIFEIGMNHKNEIRPLVKMVQPNVVIITRIAPVHLGHFKNLNEIAEAKAEIFEGLAEDGVVLLNADDDFYAYLSRKASELKIKNILSFGEADFANYRLKNLHMQPDCSCMTVDIGHLEAMVKIGAPGRHIVQNCLAIIGACDFLGVDMAHIVIALAQFSAESGRGARYSLKLPSGLSFTLIDESYNANPVSMRAALKVLKSSETGMYGRRIAVLGDMLELGKASKKMHQELAEPILDANVNPLFLVGKEMKFLADKLSNRIHVIYETQIDEILPRIINEINGGDVVMVKSSNSIRSSLVVLALLKYCKADAA